MNYFLYLIIASLLFSCTGGMEAAAPQSAPSTQKVPASSSTTTKNTQTTEETTPPPPAPTTPTQSNNVTGCTLSQEKNDRLAGSIFTNDCHEIAKLKGPVRDFFDAAPEQTVPSLSSEYFDVQRTKGSLARVDAMLIAKKADGAHFKNFHDFFQWAKSDALRLEKMFRQLRSIADHLGLSVHGYRLVIDEMPATSRPFSWRLFGQEPLGDTVQIATHAGRGHGPIVDLHAAYSPHHAFSSYLNESFHGVGYKIINFKNNKAYIFNDINPQAFIHMLAIPKGGYVSTYDFSQKASGGEMVALLQALETITKDHKTQGSGTFRFISNAGRDANQSQPHLHFHVVRGGSTALGPPAISKNAHRMMKTYAIKEILGQIDNHTLVVFDVDATLAWVPHHTWPYQDVSSKSLAEGENTRSMWQTLLTLTNNQSQKLGAKFIALTARSKTDDAAKDLTDIGLLAPYVWVNAFNAGPNYKDGVLYANHANKGEVLAQFLAQAQPHYHFKRVLFIDDRLDNSKNVYEYLRNNALGIESSISFWYQGAIHPVLKAVIGFLDIFSNIKSFVLFNKTYYRI